MMERGQAGKYLFKLNGERFTIDATVRDIKGAHIQIEFMHPLGRYLYYRWLRTPAERARFTTDLSFEVRRRGAPQGNHNAAKAGPRRQLITLSLKDERLLKVMSYLEEHNLESTTDNLRRLAYEALDAYCQ